MADLGNIAIDSITLPTDYIFYYTASAADSLTFPTEYIFYYTASAADSLTFPTYYIAEYTSSITHSLIHSMPNITKSLFQPKTLHKIIASDVSYTIASMSDTEGTPLPPSINIPVKGMFRFRWSLKAGNRYISVSAKQPKNGTPRPTMVIKANPDIGVLNDVSGSAISGTGWVVIGPIYISPILDGVIWVELHNNYEGINEPCYFDNIITTSFLL